MISLKKYLDMDPAQPPAENEDAGNPEAGDLHSAILACYRSALLAMGKNGAQAIPSVGAELQQSLAGLESSLSGNPTPAAIQENETKVEEQLQQWGDRSAEYWKAKSNEVKELLIVLARTAELIGTRDQRYASHFQNLTSQLQSIANLEDLGLVRSSLVKRATELTTYVNQMAQDSQKSVAHLQAEVSSYETKLKAAEEIALRDELTGLPNRRNIEERATGRIARKEVFSVAMLDLNRFKKVNDTYGHLAGDSLLKQFAQEIRSCLGSGGFVGRWSGDEFMLLLEGDLATATAQVERVRKWAFGEYTLPLDGGKKAAKISVDAAVGVAQWQAGETIQQMIERADRSMYSDKKLARKQHA